MHLLLFSSVFRIRIRMVPEIWAFLTRQIPKLYNFFFIFPLGKTWTRIRIPNYLFFPLQKTWIRIHQNLDMDAS